MNNDIYTEKLFSYGILRYDNVQLSTFNRRLEGEADALLGYHLSNWKIIDPKVIAVSGEDIHSVLVRTQRETDKVEGMVFSISLEELQLADQYEVADYKRVCVQLLSGINAWVYVSVHSE